MAQLPLLRPRANRLAGYASTSIPGEDAAINTRHWLSDHLAWFFVPTATGFRDLVRGDVMVPGGTVTKILTPFGPSWVLGVAGGGVAGYFSTAGGDSYYNPPSALSIACGAWNHASIANPASAVFLVTWDGLWNNLLALEQYNFIGTSTMRSDIFIAGAEVFPIASGGAIAGITNVNVAMTFCATYDGAHVGAYYNTTYLNAFGNASSAKTGSFSGIDRVTIGLNNTGASALRPILWAAGWYRTLSTAAPSFEVQYLTSLRGGIPPGLLIQRAPRTYSFAPAARGAIKRPQIIRPMFL